MTKKICFLSLIFFSVFLKPGFSAYDTPKTATVSGFVRDSKTGETLTGAVIYPKENPAIGITSNTYGYYSLSLPVGKYTIHIYGKIQLSPIPFVTEMTYHITVKPKRW